MVWNKMSVCPGWETEEGEREAMGYNAQPVKDLEGEVHSEPGQEGEWEQQI